jgi:N-acetylglucosamine-6-phosphate deacetylase
MPIISAPRLIAQGQVLAPGAVVVEGGRVAAVLGTRPPAARDHLALDQGILCPGLIDLQVNGAFGVDLVDADPEGWARVTQGLLRTGVTGFLPTFISAPIGTLAAGLGRAAAARAGSPGARILGVHLEGPFLSEARRGAHDPAMLVDPTAERVEALLEAGAGILALVTLAPEREGALEAVKRLTASGVVVSVGHSDALAAQVAAAAEAGARMVTHVFNAQRGLHHREPGVAGQALADERLVVGLVADLHHVHPAVCRIVLEAAAGRVALATDAAAAAGMPPGRYQLGGELVELGEAGPPRRLDGTIAGSNLRLDQAVSNVAGLGTGVVAAVEAASRVPADLLGRADLGRIEVGALADLTWLSDTYGALGTWIEGAQAWRA